MTALPTQIHTTGPAVEHADAVQIITPINPTIQTYLGWYLVGICLSAGLVGGASVMFFAGKLAAYLIGRILP